MKTHWHFVARYDEFDKACLAKSNGTCVAKSQGQPISWAWHWARTSMDINRCCVVCFVWVSIDFLEPIAIVFCFVLSWCFWYPSALIFATYTYIYIYIHEFFFLNLCFCTNSRHCFDQWPLHQPPYMEGQESSTRSPRSNCWSVLVVLCCMLVSMLSHIG